jgi:hypothetical protein
MDDLIDRELGREMLDEIDMGLITFAASFENVNSVNRSALH